MCIPQPGAQLVQRRVRVPADICQNGIMQARQQARRVRPLRPCRDLASAIAALPRLHHIGNADPEPGRNGPGAPISSQDPITQVLRIRLTTPPAHLRLRLTPETYESHLSPCRNPQIAIPARVRRL